MSPVPAPWAPAALRGISSRRSCALASLSPIPFPLGCISSMILYSPSWSHTWSHSPHPTLPRSSVWGWSTLPCPLGGCRGTQSSEVVLSPPFSAWAAPSVERTDLSCAFRREEGKGQQSEARRAAQSGLCPLSRAPWHHVAAESLLQQQPQRKESPSPREPGDRPAGQDG